MQIKIIRSGQDHQEALTRLRKLLSSRTRRSKAARDEIQILGMLVERYEQTRYPKEQVDPVEAIELEMEQRGLTAKQLTPYLGPPSRISEVLSRKRSLSLTQIRKLHTGLGIPLSILIQPLEQAAG